jgi:hypothetical protein
MSSPSIATERHFDPDEMALRGRIGALVTQSRHDVRELTAPARAAFLSRFEKEVDPDGVLDAAERGRRADCAKRAHFVRLALLSAKARRKDCAPASPRSESAA